MKTKKRNKHRMLRECEKPEWCGVLQTQKGASFQKTRSPEVQKIMQEGGLTDVISALHLSRKYEWEQLIKTRIKANWEGKIKAKIQKCGKKWKEENNMLTRGKLQSQGKLI